MKKALLLTALSVGMFAATAHAAVYSKLSEPICDDANHVIYDGKGNFAVETPAENTVELTLDLRSMLSYANSNDYKSGAPLLLWDADVLDYGLTDEADTRMPTGTRKPTITGWCLGKTWTWGGKIEYDTLQKYADSTGKVTLRINGSSKNGVTITTQAADSSTVTLYKAPALKAAANKKVGAYQVNLNYVSSVSLLTPSTLDTSTYTPPPDYTIPFKSSRADNTSLKRVMFLGDSITHGVNDKTWRWQLFKILVDNGIEAEIVGPRSGYTTGYTRLTTKDQAENYGGVKFPNVHLAQSSGRTHNIITGSNAGMTGVNYGGHSTGSSASTFNCDTWCCMMGTNDLISDHGYTAADFAAKMQRMLGGKVTVEGKQFTWTPGEEWGTLGKLATDILRDKDDVLYLMSVPCWGRHRNNNEANRHEAVQAYSPLLRQWTEAFSRSHGINVKFADINGGLVDYALNTPFSWPDSMSNRPGGDGLHPNEQGSLIIAGNLARAMGIAGRTAGLPRTATANWSTATPGVMNPGRPGNHAVGEFTPGTGYSVEVMATFGNGAKDGWKSAGDSMSITVGDGTDGGTLRLTESTICWGNTPLYCGDISALSEPVRITRHQGNEMHNILPGFYVWIGDMLIGQGLQPTNGVANGISISTNADKGTVNAVRWAPAPTAPTTTLKHSPTHAYYTK